MSATSVQCNKGLILSLLFPKANTVCNKDQPRGRLSVCPLTWQAIHVGRDVNLTLWLISHVVISPFTLVDVMATCLSKFVIHFDVLT